MCLLVAELVSIGQLPTSVRNVDENKMKTIHWQYTSTFVRNSTKRTTEVETKKEPVENSFMQYQGDEDFCNMLSASALNLKGKLKEILQSDMEKTYLSVHQLSTNIRRVAGRYTPCTFFNIC